MENFLIYLLKASTGILLFYLFYYLVLRNETFYVSNRWYLIAGLILAVLLPAIPISYTTPVALINNSDFFTINEYPIGEFMVPKTNESVSISYWQNPSFILSAIYLFGAGIFLLRLILQTILVAIKLPRGQRRELDGVSIVDIKGKVMPFSFFNTVIINTNEYSREELSNIIAHEKVHIQERHWVDLLIIELLTVVFWMNPIVWLYEKSIKQNHEYLADQGVLLAGYHPGQYQALLINQLMGVKILGITNNLNFTVNKKRMEMMKKEKSSGASKMKLLLVLPIVALLVFAFAKKEYVINEVQDDNSAPYETRGIEKVLSKPLRLSGEVLTLDGQPIEGATFQNDGYNFEANSNKAGKFEILIPKGYRYTETIINDKNVKMKGLKILVSTDGFESSKMIIDPAKSGKLRKIHMKANIIVKGLVLDNAGRTLVDTKIVVEGSKVETTTNREGKFEIETAQGGILMLSHHGYKTIHFALVGENIENPTIIMKEDNNRTFKIHGWVRDENGQPLEGANIMEKNTTNGTVTDDKGMYILEVSDGSSIVISYVGYKTAEVELSHRYNQNGVPSLSPTNLERGIFNIKLPDANDPNLKMQLPPPPPPKDPKEYDRLLYKFVEQMPYYYDGGIPNLALDLRREIDWITEKTKDRGEAVVGFTVAANGKIVKPHIVKSSNSKMLDESAVNIVAKLDNWWAGMQRGKRVPVDLTVPVKFE